jgi:hypothetical protein
MPMRAPKRKRTSPPAELYQAALGLRRAALIEVVLP